MLNGSHPDVLSAVLRTIRLDAAIFIDAELTAPWKVETPVARKTAPLLSPGAEHVMIFHLVTEGTAYASLGGGRRLPLEAGDVVMFPHGDAHIMGAGAGAACTSAEETYSSWRDRGLAVYRLGEGGPVTKIFCGFLVCQPQLSAGILQGVPPMIQVSIRGTETGRWLEESIRFTVAAQASRDQGRQAVMTKLTEAVFVETIRIWAQDTPPEACGWIAGARDRHVGRALSLMHGEPSRPWTIAGLAAELGVSRSVLAERFTRYMGQPPISYLKGVRLQMGAQLLIETDRSAAEVAAEVGYESEASFSRAFKRVFDCPPAQFRIERRSFVRD